MATVVPGADEVPVLGPEGGRDAVVGVEGVDPLDLNGARETLARSPGCAVMLELSRDRWKQHAPIVAAADLMGRDKIIFSVHAVDGTLRKLAIEEVEPFLGTCAFNESYIFFCPNDAPALDRLRPLIR